MATANLSEAAIRYATRKDTSTVFSFICKLAAYENVSDTVTSTEEKFAHTLSHYDPSSNTFSADFTKTLLLTDPDGTVAGIILYHHNYSPRTGTPGIYSRSLFVESAYRKKGCGKALLKELAKEVRKIGGDRLEASCWPSNEASLRFYEGEGIGATRKEECVYLKIGGDALDRLAMP